MDPHENLRGLPIKDLISAPLVACCQAQMSMNQETIAFINSLMDQQEKPKCLNFSIQKSFLDQEGHTQQSLSRIQAPLLGLVTVPSLKVEKIDIDFTMEITTASSVQRHKNQEQNIFTSGTASADIEMRGKLSCSEKRIRTTDQSSKYFIKITAKQGDPPEGLSRILDLISSSVNS